MTRARAGLLWVLLDKASRRKVAAHLSSRELQQLNDGFAEYRQIEPAAQKALLSEALRLSQSSHSGIWSIISLLSLLLATAIFIYHSLHYVLPATVRFNLFTPLLLAALSPLAIYFIPAYRLSSIFQINLTGSNLAVTVSCTLALVWTLTFIGLEETVRPMPLHGLNFLIVFAGAISAPLLEEAFFRELLPSLVGQDPHHAGHLLAATVFAAAHLPGSALMFLLYFMAAAFLSLIRLSTGSLSAAIFAHSLANATILLLGI